MGRIHQTDHRPNHVAGKDLGDDDLRSRIFEAWKLRNWTGLCLRLCAEINPNQALTFAAGITPHPYLFDLGRIPFGQGRNADALPAGAIEDPTMIATLKAFRQHAAVM